jgi:glycosyltransferase involved in cell wall biosynthesis
MHTPDETNAEAAPWSLGEPPAPAAALPPLPDEPVVSIVVPCRNPGHRLDLALESLRRQTYPHLEVIVVDGASTDGSADRLAALCDPAWRWLSEPDGGQSDAISKGFALATGQILTWLNADDALMPDAAATWARLLAHARRPALAYGGCFEWYEEVGWMVPAPWVREPDYVTLRDRSDYIMQPAAAFRADAFKAIGGLDASLHYAMDWDLWLKLSRAWPAIHTAQVLAMNRVHGETKTRTGGGTRLREIRAVGRRYGRSRFAPADWRYGLVSLSERSRPLGWLRGCYKRLWRRSRYAEVAGAEARYAPAEIRALPLDRPRRLWACTGGATNRLHMLLHGRCPSRYTVRVDGEPIEVPLASGQGAASVPARDAMHRRLDLPVLPGVRLSQVAFSKESEHTRDRTEASADL